MRYLTVAGFTTMSELVHRVQKRRNVDQQRDGEGQALEREAADESRDRVYRANGPHVR